MNRRRLSNFLLILAMAWVAGCSGGVSRSGEGGTQPAPPAGPQKINLKVEVGVDRSARESIQASGGRITQVVVEVVDHNSLDPGTLSGRRIIAQGAASVGESDTRVVVTLEVTPGLWEVHVFGRDGDGRTVAIAPPFEAPLNSGTVLIKQVSLQGDQPTNQILINPTSASIAVGATQPFSALVQLANGTSNSNVTWSSANPAIATVDSSGLATGVSPGTVDITVRSVDEPTLSTSATLVVIPALVTVTQVRLTFAPAATVRVGDPNLQFTATADFSDGTSQDVTSVATYLSTQPGVLSVNAAGQATALAAGNIGVTASFQGVTSAPVNLVVIALTQVTLTFAPATTVTVGAANLQFTAIAGFSDGSTLDVTAQATYLSTQPGVLSVNSVGQATAASAGTSNVTATFQGVSSAPLNITVNSLNPRVLVLESNPPTSNLLTYLLDTSTGSLVLVQSLPLGPLAPTNLAVDPVGNFAFVALGSPDVLPVSVSSLGLMTGLTPITGFTFPAVMTANNGRLYAYENGGGTPGIKLFTFGGGTVFNPFGGTFATAQLTIRQLLLAPPATRDQFLYVLGVTSSDILGYALNAAGSPTGTVPGSYLTAPQKMVQAPNGTFLVIAANPNVQTVSTAATGDIGGVVLSTQPLSQATSRGLAIAPNGQFVYVLNDSGPFATNIDVYSVTPAGVLAALPTVPLPAGSFAQDLAVDPTGSFLLNTNVLGGLAQIEARPINPATGALGPAVIQPRLNVTELEILP